ncbi:membrane hypothetical protein [Vibrio crassostreae]|uniref:oligosaccharide flippase family protein n=1 Tax=Vibrio crassostreae TaxID=246167 RepID=UPI0005DE1D31|nr:oligosaccharide flippase family protein [Vibrio crassostreae]TCT62623.1 Na+-driven multidrug efflux pump [Vibrio crassostreae]TCT83383.1 Na+-driven multidrug efflux pump [Vibrio crassostreae]TCU03794.1 Na+-driven multidrug efflux pump [Vibrio crassostreae]TDW09533.1 Na+-driven multidrug efflux pump [Vibrio crassostreae]CAK2051164.1 membrane hypothetical protein [Vibrio crassostreae]
MSISILERVKQQSYGNIVSNLIVKFSSIIILWVSSYYLSVEEFGRLALLQASIISFQIFASMGLSTTASKLLSDCFGKKESYTTIISLAISWLIFAIPTCLILIFFAESLSVYIFESVEYEKYIYFLSCIVFVSSLKSIIIGMLFGVEKAKLLPKIAIYTNLLVIPFGLYIIKEIGFDGSLSVLFFLEFITLIGSSILAYNEIIKKIEYFFIMDICKIIKRVLSFTMPISLSGILVMPITWVAMRDISVDYDLLYVGVISILNQWLSILIFVPVSVGTAIMPIMAKEDDKRKILSITLKMLLPLVILISLPILLFPEWLISLYGNEYVISKVGFYAMVLVLLALVLSISNIMNNLVVSINQPIELLKSNIIWSILFVITFFTLFDIINPVLNIFLSKLIAYTVKAVFNYRVYNKVSLGNKVLF